MCHSGQTEADGPATKNPAVEPVSRLAPTTIAMAVTQPHVPPTHPLSKWLGVIEATVVFSGFAGLVSGMYWLTLKPLSGVMALLASMALLVSTAAKLGEAQEARLLVSGAKRQPFSRSRSGNSCS